MRPSLVAAFKYISVAIACTIAPALAQEPAAAPAPVTPATVPVVVPEGAVTFSAPVSITGETVVSITIEDAVQLSAMNNLGLRIESFNRDTAREAVIIADSVFEPVFALSLRSSESEAAQTATLTQSSSDARITGSASVSQRVATGGTVTLGTNLGRTERVGGDTRSNLYYLSDLSLSVRQPLLAGAGFAVNRASRDRARIGVERSDSIFRAEALDVVRDTELAFFNLASAHYTLDVQRSGLATAEQFLAENEARRSAGIATELDVMQARVSVANRRALIITAEQRVRDATDELLTLFGRRDFSGILQPVGYVFAPPSDLTVERSYGRGIQNDPDIQNALAYLRQLELDSLVARSERLPDLNLDAGLAYSGSDIFVPDPAPAPGMEPNTDPSIGGAIDDMSGGDNYNWQVGLSLSLPWGLREGRARYRLTEYSVAQQRLQIEQLEQFLMVNIRAAVRSVESDKQTVEINALSTELSKREWELEKAKFDSGLSTSRLVVEAQQRWDEAKVRETQSRVQLRQDMSRLRRLEGGSLDLYGIVPLQAR